MTEDLFSPVCISRRGTLKRAGALIAAGGGLAFTKTASAFPEADHNWTSSGSLRGLLGQTIILDRNPYYNSSNPDTKPRGFLSWRALVRNDGHDTSCYFRANGTGTAAVIPGLQKTIRFPYAVFNELIAGKKEQVVENLIIGYVKDSSYTGAVYSSKWGQPDPDETLDRFGHFLIRVMQPLDTSTLKFSSETFDISQGQTWSGAIVPNEWEPGGDYKTYPNDPPYWTFRSQKITLERISRIPFTIVSTPTTGAGTKQKYFLYIGYEGGAGY